VATNNDARIDERLKSSIAFSFFPDVLFFTSGIVYQTVGEGSVDSVTQDCRKLIVVDN
jgi:hypothetical protein